MPPVGVQLHSLLFKLLLRRRLSSLSASAFASSFGVSSRPADYRPSPPSNPSFSLASPDAVATKDLHPDPLSSLHLRLFLPNPHHHAAAGPPPPPPALRRNSFPQHHRDGDHVVPGQEQLSRRVSAIFHGVGVSPAPAAQAARDYGGYLPTPAARSARKLPVIVQFHGGAFVTGAADSAANDAFCRRVARLCDAIVVAVGYRLAPESRYPAAFEDGVAVLRWIAKQANLAVCGRTIAKGGSADSFGAAMVEPWLAAHADPSRCVLLGVSCGANIADYVARKAVEAGKLLEPVRVVAQVLMYPFFMGSAPTQSELKLANSYFYDKSTCLLAWKLFLAEGEFSLDHPAANPLVPGRGPPLKLMPPTLTVVAELDWMKDRAIAYSEELRKVNVDAPVLEYKDTVHEFATLDVLLKTPQAQACAEDIAIWVKKYISLRGHELSY
ncbi:probable carboxylesterase 16 [Phragmites australis]|uniref:probable carboxylesterase 16 n=1 Tax=Phragmites australis TaxID=29695 RepID=UPI002D799EB7|nr:probable carboxylesterase 16 [Phragmites australis]